MRFGRRTALALALVVATALTGWLLFTSTGRQDRALGLFTSLPILWSETGDLKQLVDAPTKPHWARTALEQRGRLIPLDTLLDLSALRELVIAQPRPLAPEENVSLDAWVRKGGHVLLFADPMLTQDSAFALGDRRRPQDVVLVSPILARWGLGLTFDEDQPAGVRESAGEGLSVNLPGAFTIIAGGHDAVCRIGRNGLVARCDVGKGRAVLVADAALLETGEDENARISGLNGLMDEAFGR
ncbi:MAG: hypothetical protein B7X90_05275 [Novosphingobium sp. 17-62-19]|uniref:DUF4350 domain-containing protein n=1 Tax=Novosphingobium sp. 17-62-19 TaxID=1970406 RepID=UPI000BC98BAB|nr:DUF4350 domain-containing protein [Novosphingobium sp. 17-62-19]OZA20656.1 MAG: hypothetical protein B7X90_05275 [Novosphingobium sp. 17-62-19]OZA55189.1 MAG: hypothetical protein B7X78_10970 [Sphingomonadales bacterium 39-62-4]HQS98137.1 ABC transporter [Novosphingobium sp.]